MVDGLMGTVEIFVSLKTAICYKPAPHTAMLHTCEGAFQWCCDVLKSHAMYCDRKLNMLNILLRILEYLSYLPIDFQTCLSIVTGI